LNLLGNTVRRFQYRRNDQNKGNEDGFTLIEALVTTAVLGILSVVLANIVSQVTTAATKQESLSSLLTNLNIAGNQIIDDLRSANRNSQLSGSTYRFLGVDGDGTFETQTTVSHESLAVSSGEDVDHLHYHNLYSNLELDAHLSKSDPADESVSERVRLDYFLCAPVATSCSYSPLGGERGVMKRRERHDKEHLDTDGVAVPPINPDIMNTSGANPLAFNVDYLSFRYYDNEEGGGTGSWSNSWDSVSKNGDFPDAVEFAMRGYDPGGNIPPQWYRGVVALQSDS